MLNITYYQRNANQNHNEVPSHASPEWVLSKSLQTINAGECVEKKEPSYTVLGGMQTSTATMENSVEFPQKAGNGTAIRPSNPNAGHTHQGNPNWPFSWSRWWGLASRFSPSPVHPAFRGAPAQESEKSFCRVLGWRLKGIQRCKEMEKSRMMK